MPTFIKSIRTTAGFLQNAQVDFAPGLTCVIGARGTCKSTLVETIRFAFNCGPERVEVLTATTKKGRGAKASHRMGSSPAHSGAGVSVAPWRTER